MKARIENDTVVEVHEAPDTAFHPSVAEQFVDVPASVADEVQRGWRIDGDDWTAPEPAEADDPEPAGPAFRDVVSRVEFKTLFTMQEHVQIKMARSYAGDDDTQMVFKYTLDAAYDILDDPQLEQIHLASDTIKQFLGALVAGGILTPERQAEIQQGVPE